MKILVDSDVLFGLFVASDPHHKRVSELMAKLLSSEETLVTTNLVLQETATVLSHKIGQAEAVMYANQVDDLGMEKVNLDDNLEIKAWEVFMKQTKKGTSFVDCANVVVQKEYGIDKIFSFDKFYKRVGVGVVE